MQKRRVAYRDKNKEDNGIKIHSGIFDISNYLCYEFYKNIW